jgi:alpha-D-ribose 1-methylphosphonate 5-triphosphate synthase subunit PhnG
MPSFAKTFPNKNYADKPLAACSDVEILKDYQVWLTAQLGIDSKRAKAQAALDALEGEYSRRDAASAPDPIIEGLENEVQRQREERGEGAASYLDGDAP